MIAIDIKTYFDPDGSVKTDSFAADLKTTKADLARTLGISRESLSKRSRESALPTQMRLKEALEILLRVRLWAGSLPAAYAWFRAQPLAPFGGKTAEDLIKEGKAWQVREYLSMVAEGGYA